MSLFNLDRFRFDKKTTPSKQQQNGSISPESEKENKPARMRTDNSKEVFGDFIVNSDTDEEERPAPKAPVMSLKSPRKSHSQGVVFDEVIDDTDEEARPSSKARVTSVKSPRKSDIRGVVFDDVIDDTDEEERPAPKARVTSVKNTVKSHLQRFAREDVITISTDEDDEEDRRDSNAKLTLTIRAKEERKSSNIDMAIEGRVKKLLEIFPQKSREELLEVVQSTSTLDGAIAACLMRTAPDSSRKRRQRESSSSQDSDVVQPSKKTRPMNSTTEESQETDEEQVDGEPGWEEKDAMVKKLQKKFPGQKKEELKIILKQHDWIYEDALETLIMFSDPDDADSSSPESKKKSKEKHKSSPKKASPKSGTSSLSSWLTKRSDLTPSKSPSSSLNSSSLNSSKSSTKFYSKTLSKFASPTYVAKKEAEERKRKARLSDQRVSSAEEDGGSEAEAVSSEFEDSEDDLSDEEEEYSQKSSSSSALSQKEQIIKFFQESSLDELSLIHTCSLKKARKIVELRPFDSWEKLKEAFETPKSGLHEELLYGCRAVLKERTVVQGLMAKCESISSRMVKQVTQVMETGTRGIKQPSLLNSQLQLKPYQIIGLKWLLLLNQHKLSGILADEMGLGKTIQAIAFLAQLYQNGIEGPHLIVVPTSTLDNWVREFKLWCPSLEVLIYYGNQEDRRYIRRDILDGAVDFNVIVTTYNLAFGNQSDRSLFMKLRLKYALFDEGHMLKNMNSLRYRNLMEINAEHRLLLTGTPLQNNLLELMSLLNFIMPSMFSSSSRQLTKMFSMKSHEEASPFERDRIAQAKMIMKPFILRRVKSEVLKQLPAKEELIEYCPMSEKQQALYQNLFKSLQRSTTGEKRELCNVMMQLRKMANHPLLHRQYYTTEKLRVMSGLMLKEPTHFDANADLIQEDMEVMSDFELHRLCRQYTSICSYQLEKHLILDSGKFDHLTELLASLKEKGDRVVLFSQFVMMLDILEELLRHLKHRFIRLDGQTPTADRIGLIDDFNTEPDIFVFLLSTKAGGLGINLTSANVVILHDIDYNPYNDKQAEDRCHRLGQLKTVKVIKLIHKGSIEETMLHLGQKKLKLEQDMTAAEEGGDGTIPEDMASLLKASLGL